MVTFWGQKQPKKPPPTPQALSEMGDFYVTRMEPPAGCYLAKRTQQQHTALAGKPLHTCLLGLKYLFSATGLRKTKNILMVSSRHCKVKKKSQQNNKKTSKLCHLFVQKQPMWTFHENYLLLPPSSYLERLTIMKKIKQKPTDFLQ